MQSTYIGIYSASTVSTAGERIALVLHEERLGLADVQCVQTSLGSFVLLDCPIQPGHQWASDL